MRALILYIEDNFENRLLVRRILEAEGYQVVEAEDGPRGLELARSMHPDLILVDLHLPDIDGYELVRRFKQMPHLQGIPIVALTADVIRGTRERALATGCDGYIPKPIDVDALPEQIAAFLKNREALMDGEQMQPPVDPKEATILVVEDNLQNFVLIARLLGYLGVRDIQWKASGWQVLEFAGQLPRIDLILLDIHLPYEDGYEVLRQIRADPRFRGTRVVAVSAEATEDNMRRAREAGFDGFIGKPIDPDAFPDQIRRILAGEGVWTLG